MSPAETCSQCRQLCIAAKPETVLVSFRNSDFLPSPTAKQSDGEEKEVLLIQKKHVLRIRVEMATKRSYKIPT